MLLSFLKFVLVVLTFNNTTMENKTIEALIECKIKVNQLDLRICELESQITDEGLPIQYHELTKRMSDCLMHMIECCIDNNTLQEQ